LVAAALWARVEDVFLAALLLGFAAGLLAAFLVAAEKRLPTAFFALLAPTFTAVSAKAPAASAARFVIWSMIGFRSSCDSLAFLRPFTPLSCCRGTAALPSWANAEKFHFPKSFAPRKTAGGPANRDHRQSGGGWTSRKPLNERQPLGLNKNAKGMLFGATCNPADWSAGRG